MIELTIPQAETAVALSPAPTELAAVFPGLILPIQMSQEERENILYFTQEYMTADCVETVDILTTSRRRPGEKPQEDRVYLDVYGVLCHRVRLTNQTTGEYTFKMRTVFKVLLDGQVDYSYVSFVSETIFRDIQAFLTLNIRPMGQWEDPLTMIVKSVGPMERRTYKFQFVRRP
jgi:hypothetical protein